MRHQAAIFDMDGLLIDSERIALSTFEQVCQLFDLEPLQGIYQRCIGSNTRRTREILMEGYGPNFPYEKFYAAWAERYIDQAVDQPVPVLDGVVELLERLKMADRPIAVATSTRYETALQKLQNAQLLAYFDTVIGGDQVEQSKPQPHIYLRAAEAVAVEPVHCIAFEDSDNGVRAAVAAGMTVVQVPGLVTPSEEVRALGHHIVESLTQVGDLL
jgi:HAD superfamily hydrolase (TIGR01509 family)